MDEYRLFTVSEVRECEKFTMQKEALSPVGLMEQAGLACAEEIAPSLWLDEYKDVYVFAGPGNNGGDGVVIAVHLAKGASDHHVYVVVCAPENARFSEEMQYQMQRWSEFSAQHENAKTLFYFFF